MVCARHGRFIYTIDLILMTCKHQLVRNTLQYVEHALAGRVERIPPRDQLVIELTAKPAEKAKSDAANNKPAAPNAGAPVSPQSTHQLRSAGPRHVSMCSRLDWAVGWRGSYMALCGANQSSI